MTLDKKKSVLVLVANGSEDLETVSVLDVLSRAGIAWETVAVTCGKNQVVSCSNGLKLVADALLDDLSDEKLQSYDMVVLPGGGEGAQTFANSKKVATLLEKYNSSNKFVAAICASPIALPKEVFKNRKVTSYPSVKDQLSSFTYVEETVAVDGNLVTSRGPATALPFAFKLVEVLLGEQASKNVQRPMLYAN